jgi:bifunctional DNase/RNase
MPKMLQAEIWTIAQTEEGNVVLLRPKNKNLAVPVFIGQLEIQSILIGMEGLSLPRPLTHDLILSIIRSQNFVLDRVEITEIKGNTFHAQLIISGGKLAVPLIQDCRPSDALGLATRCKCPIFISSEIIKQTGISLDLFAEALIDNSAAKNSNGAKDDRRHKLLEQLDAAIETEDYEKAAKIRDMLNEL